MKRHDLLFRYLDGEITRDEDKILREIIKEDPELGKDFESFLEIDYYINKSNEEFDYPEEFINQIGNQISNQIVVDNQVRQMRRELRRYYATRFVLIPAMIATFFLSFLISVQNPEIDLFSISSNNSNTGNVNIENKGIDKIISSINQFPKDKSPINNNSNKLALSKLSKNYEILNNSQFDNAETTNNIEPIEFSLELNMQEGSYSTTDNSKNIETHQQSQLKDAINNVNFNLIQLQYTNLLSNNSLNEQFKINPKTQPINFNIFQSPFVGQSNIQINSLVGTDIFNVGVNSTNQIINSFTQSFAVEIANGSSFGLESGYMEFKSNTKKITEISSKLTKNGLNGLTIVELENNSSENPVLIRIEGVQSINYRMFWVGVFYERNFLDFNDFDVSSRISFGLSDNGIISSLKLIGKYNLTKNITLTFGSDAKIFEGSFNENQINRINSTFSLIYGVKFAF